MRCIGDTDTEYLEYDATIVAGQALENKFNEIVVQKNEIQKQLDQLRPANLSLKEYVAQLETRARDLQSEHGKVNTQYGNLQLHCNQLEKEKIEVSVYIKQYQDKCGTLLFLLC